MQRREFLQAASAAGLAMMQKPAQAEPNAVPIRLGFDTYSLRAFKWKSMQLLEYAAGLKLDTIQISSVNDYESLEPAYLAKVKDKAAALGVRVDCGIGCICSLSKSFNPKGDPATERIRTGLRVAHALGATSMRCFLGANADRHQEHPVEALMEETMRTFRSMRSEAQEAGVKITIENHSGDFEADEVKTIIEESGKDYVGSCLDSGNPMWLVEDPLYTLETLAPYVVTTHIRDSALYEHPRGAAFQWVALDDGNIDFQKFIARYRELWPQSSMQLEIITGRRPAVLNYLEPDFWRGLPKTKAEKFVRFEAIARQGKPFSGFMVVEEGFAHPPEEYRDALRRQQQIDLERSLEYAKKTLGVGVRWQQTAGA